MRFNLVVFLLLAGAMAGCRGYGGEMSREGLVEAIQQEASSLSLMRDEVRNGATTLASLSEMDAGLSPFSERLTALADQYDALVETHAASAAEAQTSGGVLRENPLISWLGNDRYRELHRAYGAMIADRSVLSDRLALLGSDLREHTSGSTPPVPGEISRYQIVPQFYRKLEYDAWYLELGDILSSINVNTDTTTTGQVPPE